MRLIDADALIHRLLNTKIVSANMLQYATAVTNMIGEAPTIEAEPVRHGRWGQCFEDWRLQIEGDECSVCGFQHYGSGISHYHYCPNCGAKMDGDSHAD